VIFCVAIVWIITGESLRLVDEEGDLLELEVEESILLVHGVAAKVIAQDDVPIGIVRRV
jgi:hypothetical protein